MAATLSTPTSYIARHRGTSLYLRSSISPMDISHLAARAYREPGLDRAIRDGLRRMKHARALSAYAGAIRKLRGF